MTLAGEAHFHLASSQPVPVVPLQLAHRLALGGRHLHFAEGGLVRIQQPRLGDVQLKIIFGRSQTDRLETLAQESVLSAYLIEGIFEKQDDDEWRIVQAKHRTLLPAELF